MTGLVDSLLKLAAKKLPVEMADEKTKAVRYGICKACPKYDAENDRCTVCKCFKIGRASCRERV